MFLCVQVCMQFSQQSLALELNMYILWWILSSSLINGVGLWTMIPHQKSSPHSVIASKAADHSPPPSCYSVTSSTTVNWHGPIHMCHILVHGVAHSINSHGGSESSNQWGRQPAGCILQERAWCFSQSLVYESCSYGCASLIASTVASQDTGYTSLFQLNPH